MRRKKPEEHENLERWLVSYADFITLLFAFFTTLYAISNVDAQKMGRMVMSMQAAFDPTGFQARAGSTKILPGSGEAKQANSPMLKSLVTHPSVLKNQLGAKAADGGMQGGSKRKKGAHEIKEDLSRLLIDEALRDKVQIVIRAKGVVISLAEAGFFRSGAHAVKLESRAVLDKISRYLSTLPHLIRIEGHTDNQRIRTARFPSNWELSTARATFMVSQLIERHRHEPRKLAAAGYAEFHPIASNDSAEGRARNRRVDIIILTTTEKTDDLDSF